ncbi:deleted in malignant brain tumors 1 protein-like isoform X4 [Lytechinus pictus]|uniref:deleted in malignant brain tumors 1 protein-like isoform X4 n=1 Tax=Lytechinus pictus TaxID=7653 RepID=UPI0030B9EC0F
MAVPLLGVLLMGFAVSAYATSPEAPCPVTGEWYVDWDASYECLSQLSQPFPGAIPGQILPLLTVTDVIQAAGASWTADNLIESEGEICVRIIPQLSAAAFGADIFREYCDPVLTSLREGTQLDAEGHCRMIFNITGYMSSFMGAAITPTPTTDTEYPTGIAALRPFDFEGVIRDIVAEQFGITSDDVDAICSARQVLVDSGLALRELVSNFLVAFVEALIPRAAEICNSWDAINSAIEAASGPYDSPPEIFNDVSDLIAHLVGFENREALCQRLNISTSSPLLHLAASDIVGNMLSVLTDSQHCSAIAQEAIDLSLAYTPTLDRDTLNLQIYQITGINGTDQLCQVVEDAFQAEGLEHVEGDVRLADGSTELEGRVEIFVNGSWSPVCDNSFNEEEAEVVCRQLGFDAAVATWCCSRYGFTDVPGVLGGLSCTGTEDNLLACPQDEPAYTYNPCYPWANAGVVCRGELTPCPLPIGPAIDWEAIYECELPYFQEFIQSYIRYPPVPGEVMPFLTVANIIDAAGAIWGSDDLFEGLGNFCTLIAPRATASAGPDIFPGICDPLIPSADGVDLDGSVGEEICRYIYSLATHGPYPEPSYTDAPFSTTTIPPQTSMRSSSTPAVWPTDFPSFIESITPIICIFPLSSYDITSEGPDFGIDALQGFDPVPILLQAVDNVLNITEYDQDSLCSGVNHLTDVDNRPRDLAIEFMTEVLAALFPIGSEICQEWDSFIEALVAESGSYVEVDLGFLVEEISGVVALLTDFPDRDSLCTYIQTATALPGEHANTFERFLVLNALNVLHDEEKCVSVLDSALAVADAIPGTSREEVENIYMPMYSGFTDILQMCRYISTAFGPRTPRLPIRLADGSTPDEGRVEVQYNGTWGTVCDDDFDDDDATVVCRQLGYRGEAISLGNLNPGSGDILYDDLRCLGVESFLGQCPNAGLTINNCVHYEDISVSCSLEVTPPILPTTQAWTTEGITDLPTRLVNGGTDNEGRLEVFYQGQWGTVCDDFWDSDATDVACRALGFLRGANYSCCAAFGQGDGLIILDDVICNGNESSIASCRHGGPYVHNCQHSEDVGITCIPYDSATGDVRLVGGNNPAEGRVEIEHNGEWGTICDDSWDLEDAGVVCRMLGYPAATDAPGYAHFGQGSGPILLDDVACTGDEESIFDCGNPGIGVNNCGHYEDAGVVCSNEAQCEGDMVFQICGSACPLTCEDREPQSCPLICVQECQCPAGLFRVSGDDSRCVPEEECPSDIDSAVVRLVGGSSDAEGRVEIQHDGVWGTICDDGWGLEDAGVICRMLGFEDALSAPGSAEFGIGSGPVQLDDVGCSGYEETILDCYHRPIGEHNCAHSEDAGVVCIPQVVRLVNGNNEAEGRVEINLNGEWGTICDDGWDLDNANVICRMLDFQGALSAPGFAQFGQGSGPIQLDDVSCSGDEQTILDCSHRPIGEHNCGHSEDAGVVCIPQEVVRLVNGNNDAEGRVEINLNGEWGTICDDLWSLEDANVICRMLGFEEALSAPGSAQFGQGSGPIQLDDVTCSGNEETILDCSHRGIRQHNCGHSEDAGVVCTQQEVVRLVNGNNEAEGRVEINLNGEWGTICDDGWDLDNANVICRMLDFQGALSAPGFAQFGQGSGPIQLDDVSCSGDEQTILDCSHRPIGDHNCGHSEDAGVVCIPQGHEEVVRLVNGNNEAEGRVEINVNGEWGTICDDLWSLEDANVICRMLGFEEALSAPGSAQFGQGSGPIQLDDVTCSGNEETILDCSHRGIGQHNCGHSEDAGVVCTQQEVVRLVNGNNEAEGRVEINLNGEWGTICDDGWDLDNANVICRMLDFEGALSAPGSAEFGQGSDPIQLDDVSCSGDEQTILDCSHRPIGEHNCGHSEDAGVVCIPQGHEEVVRLVNGNNEAEGRVEINVNGEWGTICDDLWSLEDANVICRMLGFEEALSAPGSAQFGQGSGPIQLDDVTCSGNEETILDCSHRGIGQHNCGHSEDAGVVCTQQEVVRLVNGNNEAEGRVEINVDGEWGTICDDLWSLEDASVICRMLGFEEALSAPGSAQFGQGSGPIQLDDVTCSGNEETILDCSHRGIGEHNCGHSEDAGVVCLQQEVVRLVNGNNEAEGRVEINLNGEWGTICDDGWDLDNANVICRMLDFEGALSAPGSAEFGQGSDPIQLDDVSCSGDEQTILDCSHRPIGEHNCGHSEDAGVVCIPQGHEEVVRLVNGNNDAEGRVEINVDGEWGTICDDLWSLEDANVICRMLGFEGALSAPGSAEFGLGSGPIQLDDVGCSGDEETILDCSHRPIGQHNCAHSEDAGVVCIPQDIEVVRLADGNNEAEGRVEINLDGEWGTICDDGWDLDNANVICRMLDFQGALSAPGSAEFGQGSGPIQLDDVSCSGNEETILDCSHRPIGEHNCGHGEDAGVVCVQQEVVRLVDGNNNAKGRVEINVNGEWGTICDDQWDLDNADVICRMLNFEGALSAPGSAQFGQGSGPIQLDDVSCSGDEPTIFDCSHRPIGEHNCLHIEDAGVVCIPKEVVRLANGNNEAEGRVEINVNGEWGTICDDGWDLDNANVICRMLDFQGALSAPGSAEFGQGSGPIQLDDVSCSGDEQTILDCSHRPIGEHNCGHGEDAGVVCDQQDVRLVNGNNASEGRVEVYHEGQWGTVCDDRWGLATAGVVCRMLGFPGASSAPINAHFGQGSGAIFLDDTVCSGDESTIWACQHSDVGLHNCSHREDAGVVCTTP